VVVNRVLTPSPDAPLVARLRAAGCVFAEEEARLLYAAASGRELDQLVRRRVAGEPLEHLLGRVEFAGLALSVGPAAFVPRQRTTLLARLAVSLARVAGRRPVVVELCCGVAPIAAVVLAALDSVEVIAADIDPVAVEYARRNLGPRGLALVGDLDAPLPPAVRGRVDVLAVNTPYVPTEAIGALPPEARDHEPRRALDGGADGLDVQRRLAEVAFALLAPGGHVLVETSEGQAATAARLFAAAGLAPRVEHDAGLGATVVLARRDARPG